MSHKPATPQSLPKSSRSTGRTAGLENTRALPAFLSPVLLLAIIALAACAIRSPEAPTGSPPGAAAPVATSAADAVRPQTAAQSRLDPRHRQWPLLVVPPDNPTTPAKIELGRQLFFDPLLSAGDAMSCATCHRPELGLSNGAPVSAPRPGVPGRNVSTLWNAGYVQHLLWDGRESSLEAHAILPLTLPNEMNADPTTMEAELRAIPAYVTLFDAAFGGGTNAVTFDNVTRALAAFQRTLISDRSPYDRFADGQRDALTPQQQRGLRLFFSEDLSCSQCHAPPTFANETFRIIGIDSTDPGRAAVNDKGVFGAFKVPTLRNIARTAPYMHDGSFATLDQVLDFYAAGAGRAHGFPSVDPLLTGFDLSPGQKEDLLAFLNALTDESRLPPIPAAAVSGLPVQASGR